MRVAVVPGASGAALLCELAADGSLAGDPVLAPDFTEAAGRHEASGGGSVRWVWPSTAAVYPALLRAGVRVLRCHDLALAEGLLLGREGRAGESAAPGAAWARLHGEPLPRPPAGWDRPGRDEPEPAQGALFGSLGRAADALAEPGGLSPGPASPPGALRAALDALVAVHADQLRRIAADEQPRKFGMLVAAESAGGLVAAEMSQAGLPWRADVHDQLLSGLLGPRPPGRAGVTRPARLAELAGQISAELGGRRVNPDSPAQLVRALRAAGVRVTSTRSAVLREVDHPVIPLLLEYKELARLHAAHGWSWLDTWVREGRFRPEYVVGGVVSGRWASRGGGALQIPRVLRRAVIADPGWALVVADAAQLEPRVLAALAGDEAFARAAAGGDLYAELADVFGGDRSTAKVALLSAMYGGAGGEAGQLLAVLRRRFPRASEYVQRAARDGEEGRVVRSVLGRTCPPPSAAWRVLTEESGDPEAERNPGAGRASRARGRFTRNFVVQASAADWALVLLAGLRSRLADLSARSGFSGPHLVFFQHDEVVVHCPEGLSGQVAAAIGEAAEEAGSMVFGATGVRFPMTTAVVGCYGDAK